MRSPESAGKAGELFAAFSRVCAKAFPDDRLLSCPNLSKAPNYGQVLHRFLRQTPHQTLTGRLWLRIGARYLAGNLGHLLFLLCGLMFLRLLRWRMPPALSTGRQHAGRQKLLLIDTFAVLPKIAKDGRYEELYLPGLREEAVADGREAVRLYRLYGSRDPRVLWRALKVLENAGQGLIEAHLLTPGDWLRLCRHIVLYPFALRRLARSLRGYPEHSPERYIRDALMHTAGQCVLLGEARRLAAFRLGMLLAETPRVGAPAPLIVSWYENQTVNKCFQRGLAEAEARNGRHARVIGAQLFLWPENLLNNHPDANERDLAPDKVLVSGPQYLPETSAVPYAVGPSLRYGHLFAAAAERAAVPEGGASPKPLLVLLSYHPDETRRVLELVYPIAVDTASGNPPVMYKFHPATARERFSHWLPPRPLLAEGSLSAALREAGAVIGSGSGSLAEAAILGLPVLAVEDSSGIAGVGLNYLPAEGENEIWAKVRTPAEVQTALARLLAAAAEPGHAERLRAFRDRLVTEPTPERIREAFELRE